MYKKTQTLNDLILWMQDTDDGISLKDIMEKYDVSLRTAVRMKDSIAEKYPELNEISGPYNTKRWYLPKGTGRDMVSFSMEEIHALQNASKLLASKKMIDSRYIDNVLHKIKALIGKDAINRIEPDAEALLEAEGYTVTRRQRYKKDTANRISNSGRNKFVISYKKSDGNTEYVPELETELKMKEILPADLSRYFFFDGEHIDHMGKEIRNGRSSDFADAVRSLLGLNAFIATLNHLKGNGKIAPPVHMPFFLLAAILSRTRSAPSSRSNCANDSRIFNVNLPMESQVLKCCVTDTNEQLFFSKV